MEFGNKNKNIEEIMICLEKVQQYCQEYWKIENYDLAMADTTQTWHCHHRHEIDWALPMEELIAIGRYYDVHYSELITCIRKLLKAIICTIESYDELQQRFPKLVKLIERNIEVCYIKIEELENKE